MKCIDAMPLQSIIDTPGLARAPHMTGIGCYGKPKHIARTLDRALTKFGLTTADMVSVLWRPDSPEVDFDWKELGGRCRMPSGKAVGSLSRNGQVKGFFLSAAKGRPQLHVHVGRRGKRP